MLVSITSALHISPHKERNDVNYTRSHRVVGWAEFSDGVEGFG
jgi:hypothetical protein